MYNRSNWIYKFISKLNRIRRFVKQTYGDVFFTANQTTIYVDNETYVYQKGPIIVIVSNNKFNGSKFIKLPQRFNTTRWIDRISNRKKIINENNELKIDSWRPMILISPPSLSPLFLHFLIKM
jgi:hypothetical protein